MSRIMKKLGALMLAVSLMCAVCGTAGAETGYELLKIYFMLDDYGDLGTPIVVENSDQSIDRRVHVYYSAENEWFMINGVNSDGIKEISCWEDIDLTTGLIAFVKLCSAWETIEETLEYGYSLIAGFVVDDENSIFIDNARDAEAFYEATMQTVNGL